MSNQINRHSYFSLPRSNIVKTIKFRRLRWLGHVVRIEEGRSAFKILNRLQGGLGVDGRTIFEWTLKDRYQYEDLGRLSSG